MAGTAIFIGYLAARLLSGAKNYVRMIMCSALGNTGGNEHGVFQGIYLECKTSVVIYPSVRPIFEAGARRTAATVADMHI